MDTNLRGVLRSQVLMYRIGMRTARAADGTPRSSGVRLFELKSLDTT